MTCSIASNGDEAGASPEMAMPDPVIVGSKGGAGVAEQIISQLPPHELYIEAFAGSAAVGRRKKPSSLAIFIDKDLRTTSSLAARLPRGSSTLVICGDATRVLQPERVPADAVLYLDPPYLASVRKSPRRYYRCEQLSEAEHAAFLAWAKSFKCRVLISGYASPLYARELAAWRCVQFGAGTRGGRAIECLWCNFPESPVLHDTRFVGDGFRERERIKRKVSRWVRRLSGLPLAERAAVLAAFDEAGLPRPIQRGRPRAPASNPARGDGPRQI